MDKLIRLLLISVIALPMAIMPSTPLLAADSVDLILTPSALGIKVGETFDVVIQAQSGSQDVVGVDVFLDFDSSRLEVVDVDNSTAGIQILGGSKLTTVLWNSANNSSGHIDYSAGKFSSFPKGTFTIATVSFRVLGTTSAETEVVFSSSLDRPTKIVGDTKATDVTGALTGSAYSLIAPAIPGPPPGGNIFLGGSTSNIIYTHGFSSPLVFSSNSEGKTLDSNTLVTSEGNASLFINAGTSLLDNFGNPLRLLTADAMTNPPLLPPLSKLIQAYTFGPVEACFDRSIVLMLSYQFESLPPGADEADLYIAYYDGDSWVNLKSTVDTLTKTVMADISHFGNYALMSKLVPALPSSMAISTLTPIPLTTIPGLITPTNTSPVVTNKLETKTAPSSIQLQPQNTQTTTSTSAATEISTQASTENASWNSTGITVGLVALLAIAITLGIIIGTRRKRLH